MSLQSDPSADGGGPRHHQQQQFLAVSHGGVKLVQRAKGVPTDYLEVRPRPNQSMGWN